MYPGDGGGLDRDFSAGATLIVGANGLGKTTLVTLMRHLCAGPYRLRDRGGSRFDAGGLRETEVERDIFAKRVSDRGTTATAEMAMTIGTSDIQVVRGLKDLRLESLTVDGNELQPTEEEFQNQVVRSAELGEYSDWLLIVDHLLFVMEDRAQPFWDRTVQRQLLRVLTSDSVAATNLSRAESDHISADSDFRNARYQFNRFRQRYDELAARVAGSGEVQERLAALSTERATLDQEIADLEVRFADAQRASRDAARELEVAHAELQMQLDQLDVTRYQMIEASMPTRDEVVAYLAARIATSGVCPACGQEGGSLSRGDPKVCVLCGLEVARVPSSPIDGLEELEEMIDASRTAVAAITDLQSDHAAEEWELESALRSLRSKRSELESQIRALRSKLPEGTTDLVSNASTLATLEDDLERVRSQLAVSRSILQSLITDATQAVLAKQDAIKAVFDEVATVFLVEACHLVPHETTVKIGQEGEAFAVQVFDLNLGSASTIGESRRDQADEVSESQRVFIDIAFRIALVDACATLGSGTLVVDAPEGSLDAIFASNAAALLSFFTHRNSDNRLVIASNLVEGSLLPELAARSSIRDANDERLINLLDLAAPTAAVLQRGAEYREVLARALHQDGAPSA